MPEVIVTMVFPPAKGEPAYTEVRRMEFDSIEDMQAWYNGGRNVMGVIAEERLAGKGR